MSTKHQITQRSECLRLDLFLRQSDPRITRQSARVLCEQGLVSVNGARARAGRMLAVGDVVEIDDIPQPAAARAPVARAAGFSVATDSAGAAAEKNLPLLFEDQHIVALRKPRGMHCVVLNNDDPTTVADCLALWREDQLTVSPDSREAGLVQRLDYFTEGVILAAKDRAAWEALHHELVHGLSKKRYVALVEGVPAQTRTVITGLIDVSGKRVAFPATRGELSESVATVLWSDQKRKIALVEIGLSHAVRHQVRAHLAGIGYPLVGDEQYGAKRSLQMLGESSEGFYLLAKSIELRNPLSGEEIKIRSDAPWANADYWKS